VLSAFVLLGHWFEMRARGGANEAIRALLGLAPPKAVVLRDEIAALSMSGSSFIVAVNAVMLKRLSLPKAETPSPSDVPAEQPRVSTER
jgi:Cu2+-exporting ATPase